MTLSCPPLCLSKPRPRHAVAGRRGLSARRSFPSNCRSSRFLHEADQPIHRVYFPTNGVVSLVNEPDPGEIVEVATIGYEGVAGLSALLGVETTPSRAIVQVPGAAFS